MAGDSAPDPAGKFTALLRPLAGFRGGKGRYEKMEVREGRRQERNGKRGQGKGEEVKGGQEWDLTKFGRKLTPLVSVNFDL